MTKLYLVGNFDLMVYGHKERKMFKHIIGQGYDYNRLVSFFNRDKMDNILELKKEYLYGKESGQEKQTEKEQQSCNKRINRRPRLCKTRLGKKRHS